MIIKWDPIECEEDDQSWWQNQLPKIAQALRDMAGGLYPAVMASPHGVRYFTDQEFSELWRKYCKHEEFSAQFRQRLQQHNADKIAQMFEPQDN